MRVSTKLQAATRSAISLLESNQKLSAKLRVQLIDLIYRAEMLERAQRDKQKERLHETGGWQHENELAKLKADTTVAALIDAARKELGHHEK